MIELNLDGLVGPTHHYGGLSRGNRASEEHEGEVSNPKAAALEGIAKMRTLVERGYPQGFLPPHERPNMPFLQTLGIRTLEEAYSRSPKLLSAVCSSSSMWAANSCVATPSCDSDKVHITVANLHSFLHRSLEPPFTERVLRRIFPDEKFFQVHSPVAYADEGAANHTRFGNGQHLFVYGRSLFQVKREPQKFPARQTVEAQQQIAERHGLNPQKCIFAQQSPEAIDAGVFHNDVISTGHQNLFVVHEKSFVEQEQVLKELDVEKVIVLESEMALEEAVKTYFFNSQFIGDDLILAPRECLESAAAKKLFERLGRKVHYVELGQSMRGGGGPACLRVRVPLTHEEFENIQQSFILNSDKLDLLEAWVKKHYRDKLTLKDLLDPLFLPEVYAALDELTHLFEEKNLYDFQREL